MAQLSPSSLTVLSNQSPTILWYPTEQLAIDKSVRNGTEDGEETSLHSLRMHSVLLGALDVVQLVY